MVNFFLNEEDQVFNEASAQAIQFANKLKNMRLHLQTLMNKKVRLELEIRDLKRSIDNKTKEYDRTLKAKVSLEGSEQEQRDQIKQIFQEHPDLKLCYQQVAEEYRLYQSLLENMEFSDENN